jgi:hypothetical protein
MRLAIFSLAGTPRESRTGGARRRSTTVSATANVLGQAWNIRPFADGSSFTHGEAMSAARCAAEASLISKLRDKRRRSCR